MTDASRCVAVVLAAGEASRFGSVKLLAALDGRPLLQHVLDAVADAGIEQVVVVLGRARGEIEPAIAWRAELRVANPNPELGLSSSLQVGMAAVARADPPADAVLILLGDQPRVRPGVISALLAAPASDRPIVLPVYAGGGGANPVLLRREAWPIVTQVTGDRGLGPLIASRTHLVQGVSVPGDNPDVDEPADLERLAAAEARA
jgi:molybdenum cofactor cytidylyltransferase